MVLEKKSASTFACKYFCVNVPPQVNHFVRLNQVRAQGRYLINETDNKTFWNERNNRTRIDLRNIELGNWRAALTNLIKLIDNDISGE